MASPLMSLIKFFDNQSISDILTSLFYYVYNCMLFAYPVCHLKEKYFNT